MSDMNRDLAIASAAHKEGFVSGLRMAGEALREIAEEKDSRTKFIVLNIAKGLEASAKRIENGETV